MKQAVWCWVLVCSLCCIRQVQAQTLTETRAFAMSQYEQQDFSAAIEALERVLYFSKAQDPAQDYWYLAQSYLQLNDLPNAIYYFDLTYFAAADESLKQEALLRKAQCYLLRKEYAFALAELFTLNEQDQINDHHSLDFHLGIAYYGLGKYDEAEELFLKIIPDSLQADEKEIKALFAQVRKAEKINPKRAQVMSMLLPGLGQMSYGDYRNGINSLALTTVLAAVLVRTAFNYSIIDAVVFVGPWFQRYYTGGYTRAASGAIQETANRKARAYQKILNVVEKQSVTYPTKPVYRPMTLK